MLTPRSCHPCHGPQCGTRRARRVIDWRQGVTRVCATGKDHDMSETPRDRGESSEPQESGEFRDPTAPAYDELAAPGSETPGERTEDVTWSTPGPEQTQALSSEGTQQLPSEPPAVPGPPPGAAQTPPPPGPGPAAPPQNPYAASPYASSQ